MVHVIISYYGNAFRTFIKQIFTLNGFLTERFFLRKSCSLSLVIVVGRMSYIQYSNKSIGRSYILCLNEYILRAVYLPLICLEVSVVRPSTHSMWWKNSFSLITSENSAILKNLLTTMSIQLEFFSLLEDKLVISFLYLKRKGLHYIWAIRNLLHTHIAPQ